MLGKPFLNQYKPAQSSQDTPLEIKISNPPLTDLHVHVDGGTLTRELVTELAIRNGLLIDDSLFRNDGSIYYEENNFIDFLTVYDKVADYIRTADDYEYVAYQYLKACAVYGTSYVELMFSPDHAKAQRQKYGAPHTSSLSSSSSRPVEELSYQDFVDAIVRGIQSAKDVWGIEARIVMALLRHNNTQGCMTTLDEVLTYVHPYVVGIDLVGDEAAFPASLFASVFEKAKKFGLKTAAHAGEHADANAIRSTLRALNPDRISHGLTCYTDPALVRELVEREIGLTMCLTSNVRLGAWDRLETHPFNALLQESVRVSINTDDPSFWSTNINKEYMLAKNHGDLSNEQMIQLLRNGVETSFAEPSLKTKLLAHVALYDAFAKLVHFEGALRSAPLSKAISAYKLSRTEENATQVLRSLGSQHESIQAPAQNLLTCHRHYVKVCREHELANKEQLKKGRRKIIFASNGMLTDISDEDMAELYRGHAQRPRSAFR